MAIGYEPSHDCRIHCSGEWKGYQSHKRFETEPTSKEQDYNHTANKPNRHTSGNDQVVDHR